MRLSIALALALVAAPAVARADVTVLYAAPAPTGPLVAVPVAPSIPEPESTRLAPAERAQAGQATAMRPPEPAPVTTSAPPPTPTSPPVAPSPGALAPTRDACTAPSPVRFIRTTDGSREARVLGLTDCRGVPDPESLLELSILARPRTAVRPDARDLAAHLDDPEFFASEVRRLDPGLLTRLRAIADRFPGREIEITSGYRPDANETSRHRTGHALDLRVVGAPLAEVHAVALELDESGVGLYPTSEFLHVDVRPRVTRWVDLAGPGEPANMVEVASARDGRAATAPGLRWNRDAPASPAPARPAPGPPRPTADESRALLREALEALDALEDLDLQVPEDGTQAFTPGL